MPRVTKNLRQIWTYQREQMLEEREVTQSGQRRSAEEVAIVDFDIALTDRLLELPLGAKFDAREIQRQMSEEA